MRLLALFAAVVLILALSAQQERFVGCCYDTAVAADERIIHFVTAATRRARS